MRFTRKRTASILLVILVMSCAGVWDYLSRLRVGEFASGWMIRFVEASPEAFEYTNESTLRRLAKSNLPGVISHRIPSGINVKVSSADQGHLNILYHVWTEHDPPPPTSIATWLELVSEQGVVVRQWDQCGQLVDMSNSHAYVRTIRDIPQDLEQLCLRLRDARTEEIVLETKIPNPFFSQRY